MSALDLTLYEALVSANVPKETAQTVVRELNSAIDRRYEIHNKELATRGDIENLHLKIDSVHKDMKKEMAEMETRLMRAMVDMQRWTVGAVIACAGLLLAISKAL